MFSPNLTFLNNPYFLQNTMSFILVTEREEILIFLLQQRM